MEDQSELISDHSVSCVFLQENLIDIPHPDDNYFRDQKCLTKILSPSDSKLPHLPSEFLNNISAPLNSLEKDVHPSQIPLPQNIDTPPKSISEINTSFCIQEENSKSFLNNEKQEDLNDESKNFSDNRYSPSKIESEEENQDLVAAKPKVLGKEQAKKRLMAFSLSKQVNSVIKKQCKVTASKSAREKPPNPNKSVGIQEQFRATISEIEEEKKKMLQNMPNYLLAEISELTKSSNSCNSPLKLVDKHKNETAESSDQDLAKKSDGTSSKSNKVTKSNTNVKSAQSKSRSRSRQRKHSKSRTKRNSSSGRTRRSRSRSITPKSREEKNSKHHTKDIETSKIKDLPKDWKSFKAAGYAVGLEFTNIKQQCENAEKRNDGNHGRSRSPSCRQDFKPIFDYLKKDSKAMTPLRAKPADSTSETPLFYPEKTIKFTKSKPMLIWSENPSHKSDFYMSKAMLLENCNPESSSILNFIINSKPILDGDEGRIKRKLSGRPWFSSTGYLKPETSIPTNEITDDVKKSNTKDHDINFSMFDRGRKNVVNDGAERNKRNERDKRINLVNDSYLSDDDPESTKFKEMVVGDVKVHLDLDLNSVKVRSRWDSDYESENSDKDAIRKDNTVSVEMEISSGNNSPSQSEIVSTKISSDIPEKNLASDIESQNEVNSSLVKNDKQSVSKVDELQGNLVSEYEEFLKMVSFDSNTETQVQSQEKYPDSVSKLEIPNTTEKCKNEMKKQIFETTDWDQESDCENKSRTKLELNKSETSDFVLLNKRKMNKKKKIKRNVIVKKKNLKLIKRDKLKNKSGKTKKKRKDTESSESSSESNSDTESAESKSARKKKKKFTKGKKRLKRSRSSSSSSTSSSSSSSTKSSTSSTSSSSDSASESDSGSDRCKLRRKQDRRKKKKYYSSCSDDDETPNALLKELDFKKQLLMKKIEQIDSISARSGKKKLKEERQKKEEHSQEKSTRLKKKKEGKKVSKDNKKSKSVNKTNKGSKESKKLNSSSSSDDNSGEKKAKTRSENKVKLDSGEKNSKEKGLKNCKELSKTCKLLDTKSGKSSDKNGKRSKKVKKEREQNDSLNTDTDDSLSKDGKKARKKSTKDRFDDVINSDNATKGNLEENQTEEPYKDNRTNEGDSNLKWRQLETKDKDKGENDWEASSSPYQSPSESRTLESWECEEQVNRVAPTVRSKVVSEVETTENSNVPLPQEQPNDRSIRELESATQPATNNLKTSMSSFSFNENSFCSFGQELSRDFFLSDYNNSNSRMVAEVNNFDTLKIEPRPFQSVAKSCEDNSKPSQSELYSPGHSDSDLSESEETQKVEKRNNANNLSVAKEEVYDPLDCASESSVENGDIELSNIPLPRVSEILLPGETKNFKNILPPKSSANLENKEDKTAYSQIDRTSNALIPVLHSHNNFSSTDFSVIGSSLFSFKDLEKTAVKTQIINLKSQQKLKSKAAAVFQDESDDEVTDIAEKAKATDSVHENAEKSLKNWEDKLTKNKSEEVKRKEKEPHSSREKRKNEKKSHKSNENSSGSTKGKSSDRERKRKRSRSKEKRDNYKSSPRKRRSRTPESVGRHGKDKREIRSDSFEIEPLKSVREFEESLETVQPIPVLTGLGITTSDRNTWNKSHMSTYKSVEFSGDNGNPFDRSESFDIYPSEDLKFGSRNFHNVISDKCDDSTDKSSTDKSASKEDRKRHEKRHSRSRSTTPRRKRRSKTPEKSKRKRSPKRRDKSPYSPRRRSPKRRSPRKYRSSRTPEKRRKSRSRSPRKWRSSPSRRSRSPSLRKHRSPKRHDSPKRRGSPLRSPRNSGSPRNENYSHLYPINFQSRIPVIGSVIDDMGLQLSPSKMQTRPMDYSRHATESILNDSEMNDSFYSREYPSDFGINNYSEEVGGNNLITVKSHDLEKPTSPERISLDQRIELELGVPINSRTQDPNEQYQMQNGTCKQFPDINNFQDSYNCDNSNANGDNFYQTQSMPLNSDFNAQYYNGHQQQGNYPSFQQYPNSQPPQSSMLQVGNIVEVVPTMQPPTSTLAQKNSCHQIMQVGNVLQVVPSQKPAQGSPMAYPSTHTYGPPTNASSVPPVKTQKATAVVAPSSIVPTPNPESIINPLIKAIQLEREKRKKEKEKRKLEREARRKARQIRREAKLMSVNEKLKKSVQDEGLMLGQEVEDDELLEGTDLPSPPIPVEIITVSSPGSLPPAGKGILITAGFVPKPPSEKKEVKFADGVCPGEGTSTSGGEDIASPPPKPKLPKEKRFKKKKTKIKKKVKVQIIRQIIQDEDDEYDDLSPPPPPPGDPPQVYFARFPFAGDTQFPVYQSQTTTHPTVEYPSQAY